jgi:hypothetical protein
MNLLKIDCTQIQRRQGKHISFSTTTGIERKEDAGLENEIFSSIV